MADAIADRGHDLLLSRVIPANDRWLDAIVDAGRVDGVAAIALRPIPEVPLIAAQSMAPALPGCDLWGYWPVQERDGRTAEMLQMLLSAPVLPDP